MFLLGTPSPAAIEKFLSGRQQDSFSYPEVGASSRGQPPAGYNLDQLRARLGSGEETFTRAVAALRSWQMFNLGWCRVYPADAPIEVGTNVAVLIRHFGFRSLNACRIVYLLKEEDAPPPPQRRRYGFAYGTLREHGEVGEERFSVEWRRDDSVWYDLYAFSRPGQVLARAGYPLTRSLQKRFARDSKEAMIRAVKSGFA